MKTKIPKDPKSEAALKWCVENWPPIQISINGIDPIISLWCNIGDPIRIDLRDIIKKRQPLTGIKKQVSVIVRGKKKRSKRK